MTDAITQTERAIVHGQGTGSISRHESVAFALFKTP